MTPNKSAGSVSPIDLDGMKVGILPKDWKFENCDTTHKPMMINDYW